MATELKIVTKVDDTELKKLEKTIDSLKTKTVNMDKALLGAVATIGSMAFAMSEVIEKGQEWQDKLDEINGKSSEMAYGTQKAESALQNLAHTMVKSIESSDLWKNAVDLYTDTLNGWTSILTGQTIEAIERKNKAVDDSVASIKESNAKKKEAIKLAKEEAKALDQATSALAKYNGMQERKVREHEKEKTILEEMIYIYEEQGRSTDGLIEKLEKMEATNVNATKTVRELAEERAEATRVTEEATQAEDGYTESIEKNTDSMNENTSATKSNNSSQGQTFQSSGQTISGAESYARHALGFNNGANDAMSLEWTRYLKQIADSTSDTNAQIAGY